MTSPGSISTERESDEARRRLDAALLAGEVGTFEWDVVADRLWGDANFERLFGIELDETGAAPLADYVAVLHPDDRERVLARVRRTLETGEDYEAEYRIVHGDRVRWVVVRGKVERDPRGRVVRFPGVVLDVTGKKQAEEALRASEARYRALFDSIDEGFCIIEMIFDGDRPIDYRFIEGNPAWEKHTGLYGAIGRTAREVVPGLEEHWFEIYGRVAETREPIRFEAGSEVMGRWFDVYAFPVGEPEARRVALLFNDTTEQKRTEEELSRSRERFRAVLDNALDAAYRRDLETDSYDYISPRVEDVIGIDAERMKSTTTAALIELVHPDDRAAVVAAVEEGIRSGKGRVQYRLRSDGGAYRWLADHFTVQTDADGRPLYRTGIVRDISEAKRAEAALQEARDAAEEASLAKSRFLAVMSHELRTPLTAVVGFADLLETEVLGPATAKQRESLSRIKASAWHLIGIIDEILTLSRAEAGTEEVRGQETDLAELTREVVRIVERQALDKGLELRMTGLADPARIHTDPGKVRQILINLIGNAVKYTEAGLVEVGLDRTDPETVVVRVRDTGPGIPADDHERIFEPFTQVDSSHTRKGGGTGLGLAISRRLARLLGGDVTIHSRPGAGSTFILTLPVDLARGGTAPAANAHPGGTGSDALGP